MFSVQQGRAIGGLLVLASALSVDAQERRTKALSAELSAVSQAQLRRLPALLGSKRALLLDDKSTITSLANDGVIAIGTKDSASLMPPSGDIDRDAALLFNLARIASARLIDESTQRKSPSSEQRDIAIACEAFNAAGMVLANHLLTQTSNRTEARLSERVGVAEKIWQALISQQAEARAGEASTLGTGTEPGGQDALGVPQDTRPTKISDGPITQFWSDEKIVSLVSLASTFSREARVLGYRIDRPDSAMGIASYAKTLGDVRPNPTETFSAWSKRQCQRLTFQDVRAVNYLEVRPDVDGDLRNRPVPVTAVNVAVKNVSLRPIHAELNTLLLSFDPAMSDWNARIERAKLVEVDVPARSTATFSVQLPRYPGGSRGLVLFVDHDGQSTPTRATFTGPALAADTCFDRLRRASLPPSSLEGVILQVAKDAPNNFRNFVKNDNSKPVPEVLIKVPGAVSSNLIESPGGQSSIYSTLYDGASHEEAERIFAGVRDRLIQACGDDGKPSEVEGPEEARSKDFVVKYFSRDSSLNLNQSKDIDWKTLKPTGREQVTFSIQTHMGMFHDE